MRCRDYTTQHQVASCVLPNQEQAVDGPSWSCHIVWVLEVWPPYTSFISTQLSQSFSAHQLSCQCQQLTMSKPIVWVIDDKQQLAVNTPKHVMLTIVTNHFDAHPSPICLNVHSHQLLQHHPSQVIHNLLFHTAISQLPPSQFTCMPSWPSFRHLNTSRFQALSYVAQFACGALSEKSSQQT